MLPARSTLRTLSTPRHIVKRLKKPIYGPLLPQRAQIGFKAPDGLLAPALKDFRVYSQTPNPDLDLKARVPLGRAWAQVEKWIVFSDLHVNTRTLNVCQEVLRRVRLEAEALDAGILFLGDFWHARGSLPVQPLNLVLEELKQWKQPTLMLVGNHDQVTLGGQVHGLTPLAAACPTLHVLDQPTCFLDALWLPYRRDPADIQAALQAAGPIKAVFGHADVLGAFVNESFQAREGLAPSIFPAVPVYLGHYHKPHRVQDTTICYVGSPYQVSRSEGGQQKALLVLDQNWRHIGSIPLNLGPRHFFAEGQTPNVAGLRPGDRVRWAAAQGMDAEAAESCAKELRLQGVEVEVVLAPESSGPRIEAAEDLGASTLFQLYAENVGLSPEVRKKGLNILQDLEASQGSFLPEPAQVEFEHLEIEGYGPFREKTGYALGSRGLRVVSGRNEDDSSSDSNGAGKSALVMAALWGLTGRSESRTLTGSARGLTGAEVVHDDSKLARVSVQGLVNGAPFSVERSVRRRGLVSLRFFLAGEDLTGAEAKLTQAAIDRVLACNLLTRVVFHAQSDVAGLLEADDREFKAELGRIVDVDTWEEAKERSAEQLRAARLAAAQQEHELAIHTRDISALKQKLAAAEFKAGEWDGENQQLVFEASDAVEHGSVDLRLQLEAVISAAGELRKELQAVSASAALPPGQEAPETGVLISDDDGPPDPRILEELKENLAKAEQRAEELEAQTAADKQLLGSCEGAYNSRVEQKEEFERLQSHKQAGAAVCDRCLQPIDAEQYQSSLQRLRGNVQAALELQTAAAARAALKQAKLDAALAATHKLRQEVLEGERELWRHAAAQEATQRENARLQNELWLNSSAANSQVRIAEELLRQAAEVVTEQETLLSDLNVRKADFGAAVEAVSRPQGLEAAGRKLQYAINCALMAGFAGKDLAERRRQFDKLSSERNPFLDGKTTLQGLLDEKQQALVNAQAEQKSWQQESVWLKELDAALGRTGVQSFALEGVLGELQQRTAVFLEHLSSGTILNLNATRPATATKGKESQVERITKSIIVRSGGGAADAIRERSVRQLSGGERRRAALALTLGFADLISARSRLRCNLLVLDEVMQQLDEEGCARVAHILKRLPQANILVIGQADSYVMKVIDKADIVVKRHGCSHIESW